MNIILYLINFGRRSSLSLLILWFGPWRNRSNRRLSHHSTLLLSDCIASHPCGLLLCYFSGIMLSSDNNSRKLFLRAFREEIWICYRHWEQRKYCSFLMNCNKPSNIFRHKLRSVFDQRKEKGESTQFFIPIFFAFSELILYISRKYSKSSMKRKAGFGSIASKNMRKEMSSSKFCMYFILIIFRVPMKKVVYFPKKKEFLEIFSWLPFVRLNCYTDVNPINFFRRLFHKLRVILNKQIWVMEKKSCLETK